MMLSVRRCQPFRVSAPMSTGPQHSLTLTPPLRLLAAAYSQNASRWTKKL